MRLPALSVVGVVMTWVRIDDHFHECAELAGASGDAVALWLYSLMWNNRTLADGAIPKGVLLRVLGAQRGLTPDQADELADELVASGAWATDGGDGYRIILGLELQPSREQVLASREKGAERFRKWKANHANGVSNATASGSGTGDDDDPYTASDIEDSSSSPQPRSNTVANAVSECVSNAYLEVSGKRLTPAKKTQLATLEAQYGPAELAEALQKATEAASPIAYAETVLQNGKSPVPVPFVRNQRDAEIEELVRERKIGHAEAVAAYESGERAKGTRMAG